MNKYITLLLIGFLIISCKENPVEKKKEQVETVKDIQETILKDQNSFYYIDFSKYPKLL